MLTFKESQHFLVEYRPNYVSSSSKYYYVRGQNLKIIEGVVKLDNAMRYFPQEPVPFQELQGVILLPMLYCVIGEVSETFMSDRIEKSSMVDKPV